MGLDIYLLKTNTPPEKFAENFLKVREKTAANELLKVAGATVLDEMADEFAGITPPDDRKGWPYSTGAKWMARNNLAGDIEMIAKLPSDFRPPEDGGEEPAEISSSEVPGIIGPEKNAFNLVAADFGGSSAYWELKNFIATARKIAEVILDFDKLMPGLDKWVRKGIRPETVPAENDLKPLFRKAIDDYLKKWLSIGDFPADFMLGITRRLIAWKLDPESYSAKSSWMSRNIRKTVAMRFISRYMAAGEKWNPDYDTPSDGKLAEDGSWELPEKSDQDALGRSDVLKPELDYFKTDENLFSREVALLLTLVARMFENNLSAIQHADNISNDDASPEAACRLWSGPNGEAYYWRKDYKIVDELEGYWLQSELGKKCETSLYHESVEGPAALYLDYETFCKLKFFDTWMNWDNDYIGVEYPLTAKEAYERAQAKRNKWLAAEKWLKEDPSKNYLAIVLSP